MIGSRQSGQKYKSTKDSTISLSLFGCSFWSHKIYFIESHQLYYESSNDIDNRWTPTKIVWKFHSKRNPAHFFIIHFQIWKHVLISKMASCIICVPIICQELLHELRLLNIIWFARNIPVMVIVITNGRLRVFNQ